MEEWLYIPNSKEMRTEIGKVSNEERDEIQSLFERRNGLNELASVISIDNQELYERLVKDLGVTNMKFKNWWDRMADKYHWEGTDNGVWEIDFATCVIFLVTEDKL